GYTRINNTAHDPGTNYHVSNYATVNFMVQPTTSLLFGAEYVYGSLLRKNDFYWVAPRIQASVTYYLNTYPKEKCDAWFWNSGRCVNCRSVCNFSGPEVSQPRRSTGRAVESGCKRGLLDVQGRQS